jgi:tetratricopeptide (TPR) repeat protein
MMNQQELYLAQKLAQAKQLHSQGNLDEAQKAYLSILKLQTKNPEALHGLGLITYVQKKYQESIKYMNQAIQIHADESYLNNRGTVYFALKKYTEAEMDYKKALRLKPGFADAEFNLANLFSEINRSKEALDIYDLLIQRNPNDIEALYNRGNTYSRIKNFQEAILDFNQVIALQPNHINALLNRGNAYLGLEDLDLAIASYSQAIELQPNYVEALLSRANSYLAKKLHDLARQDFLKVIQLKPNHKESYFSLGNVYKDTFYFHDAAACYQQAIAIDENYYDALTNLANTLRRLKAFDEAAVYYSRAVQANPNSPEPYSNLGNILHDLKRTDLAIDAYLKSLEIEPNYKRGLYNLGNIFKELNQLEEALKQFEFILSTNPSDIETHFARGMVLLTLGRYKEGFKLYEYRWQRESLITKLREYEQPLWTGHESLEGKTILIYIEQGLGDTIQFGRLMPELEKRGAKVLFEVQKPLVNLMKQIRGVSEVIPYQDELPQFDYFCPLLSLPAALELDVQTIPLAKGYLQANSEYVSKWQNILGEKTKPRIGLVCSGNPQHENDQNRSILLFNIIPHLPKEFEYITLQKEMREVDRELIKKYPLFKSYGDHLENFDDTAALCELMDIVISVDTSVAHLSGALAKKTFLLIPYCPDWRWMLERTDTPWYDSMKIYRQEFSNDWTSTFTKLAQDLKKELLD